MLSHSEFYYLFQFPAICIARIFIVECTHERGVILRLGILNGVGWKGVKPILKKLSFLSGW